MNATPRLVGFLSLVLCLSLQTCLGAQAAREQQKAVQTKMTVTGKLERVMAIGAETTGWAIQLDSEKTIEGKPVNSVEIDYHGPKKLEDLQNKPVKAMGKVSHRHGVETGDRIVLEVSSIREVKVSTKK